MNASRISAPFWNAAFLAAVLLASSLTVYGQATDREIRYRLAKGLEQSGEWEKATSLYEDLMKADPQNYMYFDGLRQCYLNLKEYDKAIDLIRRRLIFQPEDPSLLSQLASTYYLMGEQGSADSLWSQVIDRNRTNTGVYRLVASQMIDYRLYEQAIAVYQEGRAATSNTTLFADELASLYSALLQFEAATREYVGILRARPQQLSYVESRLGQLTTRQDGLPAALSVVREEITRTPDFSPLHALLAWLDMEDRDYASALEEYRIVDRLNKANGTEIFNFGQRAAKDGAYQAAALAFRDVLESPQARNLTPYALFGYARALEEVSSDTTLPVSDQEISVAAPWPVSESRPAPAAVVALYRRVAEQYPRSEIAAQAWERIGSIEQKRLHDLDAALAAYNEVRSIPVARSLAVEASFAIGDLQVSRNDLAQARNEFAQLSRSADQAIRDRARLRLAELDYYEARFDTALAVFSDLTKNVNSDLANDALQYSYFLQENKESNPRALAAFARADLLMRQDRSAEALAAFQSIRRQFPAALLTDDAMMRIGRLFLQLAYPDSALRVYRFVADSLSESLFRDRAQLRIGEIYERVLRSKPLAIEAYEKLLTLYPHSLYVDEVRKRIRLLRGDLL